MKINKKEISKTKIELEIEIGEQEFNNFIDEAIKEFSEVIEIEGFRKGKAPRNLVEEKVGEQKILMEAAEHAISHTYRDAVISENIEPISQPEVEILKLAKGNPLIFKATTMILPSIDLPDYKSIASEIKKNKVVVEEKEIDETLKWLLKSRAKYTLKNGPAEKGDFVEIEYRSSQIKEVDQGQKDGFVLGEGSFIPGFEEKITGMKAEEEKDFELDMPSDHPLENIRGKKIDFHIKLKSVNKCELPELNDEFVKSLGNFQTLEELKENIKKGIKAEKEQNESQRLRNEILEKISEKADFEIPEILIERERDAMLDNLKHDVSHKFNISFEEYLSKIKKTEEELSKTFKEEAKKRVKKFLILMEIGKKEKIEVSDEEVRDEINHSLKHYPDLKSAPSLDEMEKMKEYTRGVIQNEKIFSLLEKLTK